MEAVARDNDLIAASLAAFAEKRLDGEPGWLAPLRRDAFARFTALGFPTPKDEAWRYTSVAGVAGTAFRLANERHRHDKAPHPGLLPGGEGARVVFVNGRYSAELSRVGSGAAVVKSLAQALREEPETVRRHLATRASFEKSAFTALNTAFLEDGAFVRIPRGAVLAEPIHLAFLSAQERDEPTVSHPRVLVVAEENSQVAVVESYSGDGTYFTNAVTEIVCGDGAVVEHFKVQREGPSAFHVQTLDAGLGRAASLTSHNVCLGSRLARTDWNVLFGAEGSECALNGLFLTGGAQHIDNHTLIDHAKPHCTSRELYKGILDGKSRGVFHGKIIVRPDAQKTDAIQINKNLLLSREALVNSTPALEILADDVKCRHGSTIGQLDAGALFYLRSRGIGEADARALLTYGFASDLAARIRVRWIREEIEAVLGMKLPRTAEAA